MVEYGKIISEYNVGDIVYIYLSIQTATSVVPENYNAITRYTVIAFDDTHAKVQSALTSQCFNFYLSTIALTEQEYEDMQLEEKFQW